jgi:xylono-1,5-lactonase
MTSEAEMRQLVSGFGLVEGPAWDGSGLVFSDVPRGGVYRLDASTGDVAMVIPKRRGVGGIAVHADGGLVVSGRNIQHVRDGEIRVLYEDATAAGFNDLGTDGAGRVYFGSLRHDPFAEGEPFAAGEAYRVNHDGSVDQLYEDVGLTNGIGFSPDGSRMYHADSARGHVILHDVDGDTVLNRRVFATVRGDPDGLAVDAEGGVWVACPNGGCVRRYRADGSEDRELPVPQPFVTSCCFGGPDLTDLYVVTAPDQSGATGSVYVQAVDVAGLPLTPARV